MNLQLISDHGSQYDSADFMNEIKFLGKEMSKAFVRSPQCNGIIERFHRTLEEQVLQVEVFTSFEKAHYSINQFINNYNNGIIWRLLGNIRIKKLEDVTKKLNRLIVLTKEDKKE